MSIKRLNIENAPRLDGTAARLLCAGLKNPNATPASSIGRHPRAPLQLDRGVGDRQDGDDRRVNRFARHTREDHNARTILADPLLVRRDVRRAKAMRSSEQDEAQASQFPCPPATWAQARR